MEVVVANTPFDSPLFVKMLGYVQELASLEDVFDLLDGWPDDNRGDAYCILLKLADKPPKACFRCRRSGRIPAGFS
jgi:hypothetical protein